MKNLIKSYGINFLFALFVLLISFNAIAFQESIDNSDAKELNTDSTPAITTLESVEEDIQAFYDKKGIIEGQSTGKSGKVYYSAVQTVQLPTASPSWTNSRLVAYEKAFLKAKSKFIFDQFGRIVTETEQEIFEDYSSNSHDFPQNKVSANRFEAILNKLLLLEEDKLNKLLEEAGLDPNEYNTRSESERKDLFLDKFIQTSISKAMGDSSGLIPLKTFTNVDEGGNYAIGVIALYSHKLKQLASNISKGKEPFLKATKGKSLSKHLSYKPEELETQFGIRVVFDESGKPMILSYGQWGFGYSGNNSKRLARQISHAANQANMAASENIATFANSRLAMEESSTRGEITENFLVKTKGEVSEEDITTFIDRFYSNIKQRSSASLKGSRVVKNWKYQHPHGHQIVGRVRMWSFDSLENARNIANPNLRKKGAFEQSEDTESDSKSSITNDEEEEFFD